jgi:hypothetical protein
VVKLKPERLVIMKNSQNEQEVRLQNRDTMFRACFKVVERFMYLLGKCRGSVELLKVQELQDLEFIDFQELYAEDLESFGLESSTIRRERVNDVSFLTKDGRFIILVEHQTKITPNLALRLFIYYFSLISLWIKKSSHNVYTAEYEIW